MQLQQLELELNSEESFNIAHWLRVGGATSPGWMRVRGRESELSPPLKIEPGQCRQKPQLGFFPGLHHLLPDLKLTSNSLPPISSEKLSLLSSLKIDSLDRKWESEPK